MKNIIIIIITVFLCSKISAQTQTDIQDTSGIVRLFLGIDVHGIPGIVLFDNNTRTDTNFKKLTTLIATYRATTGYIKIDSICYDLLFYKSGDFIQTTNSGFDLLKNNTYNKLISEQKAHNYDLIIKVTKVVLSNGTIIKNPKVHNEQINVIGTQPYANSIYSVDYCKNIVPTFPNCEAYKKENLDLELLTEKRLDTKLHRIKGDLVESLFPGVKFHIK